MTATAERDYYEQLIRGNKNEQGIQGFIQFVNEQEAIANRIRVPDPQYFSESPEAAMEYAKSQQKGHEEGLPPTEQAIQELKRFQMEAKEADPAKLLSMID